MKTFYVFTSDLVPSRFDEAGTKNAPLEVQGISWEITPGGALVIADGRPGIPVAAFADGFWNMITVKQDEDSVK